MLLSLDLFKRDAESAAEHLQRIAENLTLTPGEERRIICADAFNHLRANKAVVELFPDDVRALFLNTATFPLFNVIRRSRSVSTQLVAAYMMPSEDAPAEHIGGRLFSIDEAPTIFGNETPLASTSTLRELTDTQTKLDEYNLEFRHKISITQQRQNEKVRSTQELVQRAIEEATRTLHTRHLIVDAFAHASIIVDVFKSDPFMMDFMQVVTGVADAIYKSALSRDAPFKAKYYARLPLGGTFRLPSNFETAKTALARVVDRMDLIGRTFHNDLGHRWLLSVMNERQLIEHSDFIDGELERFFATVDVPPQHKLIAQSVRVDTFPPRFVYRLASRGAVASITTKVKSLMLKQIRGYFALSRRVLDALEIIKKWRARPIYTIVSMSSVDVQTVQEYNALSDELGGDNPAAAYLRLLKEHEQFSRAVLDVFGDLQLARPVTASAINSKVEEVDDFDAYQRRLITAQLTETIGAERSDGPFTYAGMVRTDARAFLSLARRYPETVSSLLESNGEVDFSRVAPHEAILMKLGARENVVQMTLFPFRAYFNHFGNIIDALHSMYARIDLIYRLKLNESPAMDPDSSYASFASRAYKDNGARKSALQLVSLEPFEPFDANSYDQTMRGAYNVSPLPPQIGDFSARFTLPSPVDDITPMFSVLQTVSNMQFEDSVNLTAKRVFTALDLLMGGVVDYRGAPLKNTECNYEIDDALVFSVYMPCLAYYVYATRRQANNTALFDTWRYLVDHFDNFSVPQEDIGARRFSLLRIVDDSDQMPPVVPVDGIQAPQENTLAQSVIQFTTTSHDVLTMIYGRKNYFAVLKHDYVASLRSDVLAVVFSWLSPNYLHVVCQQLADRSTSVSLWMEAKVHMHALTEKSLAIAIYHALSAGRAASHFAVYNRYIEACLSEAAPHRRLWNMLERKVGRCAAWALTAVKSNTWHRRMVDKVLDFASMDVSIRPDVSVHKREYNEFAKVFRYHTEQQQIASLYIARLTLFAEHAHEHSVLLLNEAMNTLDDPRTQLGEVITLVKIRSEFDQIMQSSETVGLAHVLSSVLNDENLSLNALLSLLFVVSFIVKQGYTVAEVDEILDAPQPTNWFMENATDRIRHLFNSQGVSRETLYGLTNELSRHTQRVRNVFAECTQNLCVKIGRALFKSPHFVEGDQATPENIDTAMETLFTLRFNLTRKMSAAIKDYTRLYAHTVSTIDVVFLHMFDRQRTRFIDTLERLRESKDEALLAELPVFFRDFTKAAVGTGTWETTMDDLTAATLLLARHANFLLQRKIDVARRIYEQLCALELSPARILRDFTTMSPSINATCTYFDICTFLNLPVGEWTPSEVSGTSVYLREINDKLTYKLPELVELDYEYALPPLVYLVYALSTYHGMIGAPKDVGYQRLALHGLRNIERRGTNIIIDWVMGWTRPGLTLLQFLSDLHVIHTEHLPKFARRHVYYVIWSSILSKLIAALMTQQTRIEVNATFGEPRGTIMEMLCDNVARWISRNIERLYAEAVVVEADEGAYYRVLTEFNPLVTKYGMHYHIASALD